MGRLATELTEVRLSGVVTIDPLDNKVTIDGKPLGHWLYEVLAYTEWVTHRDAYALTLGKCSVTIERADEP
jgi:hypothetical protein